MILAKKHIILGVLLVLCAGQAWGATIHVSTTGTDNATCGAAQGATACLTVEYAVESRAIQGDTIEIGAGTYAEGTIFPVYATGSGTTTVKATTGAVVTLSPTESDFFLLMFPFDFQNITFSTDADRKFVTVYNNDTSNFTSCIFSRATYGTTAFYIYDAKTPTLVFERCSLRNLAVPIQLQSAGGVTAKFLSCQLYALGIIIQNDSTGLIHIEAYNSTFAYAIGNNTPNFLLYNAGDTIKAYNNVMTSSDNAHGAGSLFLQVVDAVALDFLSNPSHYDVKYNITYKDGNALSYQNLNNFIWSSNYYLPVDPTNKYLDPDFVNFAGEDLHLGSSSFANGRCSDTYKPTYDILGYAWTSTTDCGAFANSAITPAPTLTSGLVTFAGDSLLYASGLGGATNGNYSWQQFATLTGLTVSTGTETNIVGLDQNGATLWAHYIALNYHPQTVITDIGLNSLLQLKTVDNTTAAAQIVRVMQVFEDYGIRPIHIGSGSLTGGPPDNTTNDALFNAARTSFATNGWSYDNLLARMMYRSDWADADVYYADIATDAHINNHGNLLIASIAANLYYNRWFCWVDAANTDSLQAGTYLHPLTKAQVDDIAALNGVRAREKGKFLAGIPGKVWDSAPKYYTVP